MIAVKVKAGGRIPRRIITVGAHMLGHGQQSEDPKTILSAWSIGVTRAALPRGKHEKVCMIFTERGPMRRAEG